MNAAMNWITEWPLPPPKLGPKPSRKSSKYKGPPSAPVLERLYVQDLDAWKTERKILASQESAYKDAVFQKILTLIFGVLGTFFTFFTVAFTVARPGAMLMAMLMLLFVFVAVSPILQGFLILLGRRARTEAAGVGDPLILRTAAVEEWLLHVVLLPYLRMLIIGAFVSWCCAEYILQGVGGMKALLCFVPLLYFVKPDADSFPQGLFDQVLRTRIGEWATAGLQPESNASRGAVLRRKHPSAAHFLDRAVSAFASLASKSTTRTRVINVGIAHVAIASPIRLGVARPRWSPAQLLRCRGWIGSR